MIVHVHVNIIVQLDLFYITVRQKTVTCMQQVTSEFISATVHED